MTGTVPQRKESRKEREDRRARFKSALALARTTAKDWCATPDVSVSEQHLYAVLKGERESLPLISKIEAFIDQYRIAKPSSASSDAA